MKEYQQRQEAINRHLQGEKITSIACLMGKSRKWVHQWIKRYNNNQADVSWFKDENKAPKNIVYSLTPETEQQVLFIRKELMKEKMARIGAISIQYECERRGIKPFPATTGCVYYIRFIRSDLKLYLSNEAFKVKAGLKYSYVVAEINIENHCLVVRQNNEIVQVFHYPIDAVTW